MICGFAGPAFSRFITLYFTINLAFTQEFFPAKSFPYALLHQVTLHFIKIFFPAKSFHYLLRFFLCREETSTVHIARLLHPSNITVSPLSAHIAPEREIKGSFLHVCRRCFIIFLTKRKWFKACV